MNKNLTLSLTAPEKGRLDKVLVAALANLAEGEGFGLSRARLQALIKNGYVNGKGGKPQCDPSQTVQEGDAFTLCLPPPVAAEPQAQAMDLTIIYEDSDLLVIDKPAGLVVHPAAGNWDRTLVNALLAHCGASLSGIGGVARPGIVHRLDKDTSGLMVVAKNDYAHQRLTAQFADRSLSRVYQALVWGAPQPLDGTIQGAIGRHPKARQKMAVVSRGGKEAITHYETLELFGNIASLVSCKLATGRTHQIRVHMASIGHALVGDPVYGVRRRGEKHTFDRGIVAHLQEFPRQALHAGEIKMIHPRTGKVMKFKAPLPADMKALLKRLKSGR